MARPKTPFRQRFMKMFDAAERVGDCILWRGRFTSGYGAICDADGAQKGAHRVSWEMFKGPIPDGMHVLHRCDNPPCVNPDHFFLGDQRANNNDRIAKQRTAKGEEAGGAVLSAENVRHIRARYASGEKQADLAVAFGVQQPSISDIVNLKRWKHIQV